MYKHKRPHPIPPIIATHHTIPVTPFRPVLLRSAAQRGAGLSPGPARPGADAERRPVQRHQLISGGAGPAGAGAAAVAVSGTGSPSGSGGPRRRPYGRLARVVSPTGPVGAAPAHITDPRASVYHRPGRPAVHQTRLCPPPPPAERCTTQRNGPLSKRREAARGRAAHRAPGAVSIRRPRMELVLPADIDSLLISVTSGRRFGSGDERRRL